MNPRTIVHRISGPPGTGKTTALLNIVEGLLERGVAPEQIIYTTFTQAGAYEARDRACARFNLPEERFPWFRTLHSLCYRALPPAEIMAMEDWFTIGRKLKLMFSITFGKPDNVDESLDRIGQNLVPWGKHKGDQLRSLVDLARVRQIPLAVALHEYHASPPFGAYVITLQELEHFAGTVAAYRRDHFKYDFIDLLEKFLAERNAGSNAPYLIVDEAQDLSLLQWHVIDKLSLGAREAWVASDVDQTIYAWNGSDPKYLAAMQCNDFVTLGQSYRLPRAVFNCARKILQKIPGHILQDFKPRDEEGSVQRIVSLHGLDLTKGTWLILARHRMYLREYYDHCMRLGQRFEGVSLPPDLVPKKAKNAPMINEWRKVIKTWKDLQGGGACTAGAVRMLYMRLRRGRVDYGAKITLKSLKRDALLTMNDLVNNHGLSPTCVDTDWDRMMKPELLDEGIIAQLMALENAPEQPELVVEPPPINVIISTIHGAKGKEADNVVLDLRLTRSSWDNLQRNMTVEHRNFYVGATRAKHNLYLITQASDLVYDIEP